MPHLFLLRSPKVRKVNLVGLKIPQLPVASVAKEAEHFTDIPDNASSNPTGGKFYNRNYFY